MTCLPTTYEGYSRAIAWYALERSLYQFDHGYEAACERYGVTPKMEYTLPTTTEEAVARIVAQVHARAK